MGRPPLTEDQVEARVQAYCRRYGVSAGPEGLPPFPSGKRESRQHREWLTVYRAVQRFRLRAAPPAPRSGADPAGCPVCAGALEPALAVPFARRGRPAALHPACAELARLAARLGPGALAGVGRLLWPKRVPGT